MALVTRCPNCAMTFRVTPLHLRVRNGKVKCGHCAYIFNGFITLAIVEEPAVPVVTTSHPLSESSTTETPAAETFAPVEPVATAAAVSEPSLSLSDTEQARAGQFPVEETAHPVFPPDQPAASVPDGNEIIFPVDFAALEAGLPDAGLAHLAAGQEMVSDQTTAAEEKTGYIGESIIQAEGPEVPAEFSSSDTMGAQLAGESVSVPEAANEDFQPARELVSGLQTGSSVEPESEPTTEPAEPAEKDGELPAEKVLSPEEAVAVAASASAEPASYAFETPAAPPGKRIWGLASLLLLIVLVIQAVYTYRTTLAALVPQARPLLETYCAVLLCDVPFPKDVAQLNIESSELQADQTDTPEDAGIITLTATIRNHASFSQALPAIELVFTNELDQPLAKRILMPAQYLEKGVSPDQGIAAGQEITVRLFIDNAGLNAVGYKLFLFYP